jgi:hypothetical protein
MKPMLATTLCAAGAVAAIYAAAAQRETTVTRTLRFDGSGERILDIRAITGSIQVSGYDGTDVQVEVRKAVDGDSDEARRLAEQDVTLDISDGAPRVALVVRQLTWPSCGEPDTGRSGWPRRRYRVRFDFIVRVPQNTRLELCTINGGDITVTDTTGDFDLRNVNGRVSMTGIRGSGSATTVNGPLTATFLESPRTSSSFRTINGDVDLTFPASLAAEFSMKTMHGDLLTDFDVELLARPVAAPERRDGRYVYRSNGTRVRVGRGGPDIRLETLNGDVRIRRAAR